MSSLPTGTVTFLFTDIEGSTKLWEQNPEAMKAALAKHDSILKEIIESNKGYIIKTTGDGVHTVFSTAIDAINASILAQRNLHSVFNLNSSSFALKARMGLHTGEAELRDNDYYGQTLNRAARIMSAGHGGQILVSGVTAQVAREHLSDDITLLDLGEYNLKGLSRSEQIFQVLGPDLQKEFPPLTSIAMATNNLPTQLTSFIGRERELKEARERLLAARLLTLIGPGGTGKTRLSLQLGADVLPLFAEGVWFIELAPLADPALILQTVASVLGVRAQMGMPLINVVQDFLRGKNLLLIFDNCEHLVEASAQLADDFLHNAPNIKIVASSREALSIGGETVYRVPSLGLPNQASASHEALAGYESIQLFVERARAANPKFDLTEKNAPSVAQICRRLDGIPLALELAAARVTVFSAEQIASRLDDRFKLLTGGSRTALPRQQTLRALIDWSYDILPKEECMLLRSLSVFAGGWTFEAAEAICSDLDVLTLLSQLVNKSLVTVDEEGDEPRYRLLETIRQYARDKLLDMGEAAEMRNRHLDYYVQFSENSEGELFGSMALNWVNRLEAEYDNLRTAIEWGMDNDVLAVLRMGGALPNFWFRRGYESEAIKWMEEALAHADALPQVEGAEARQRMVIIAKAWQASAWMSFSQGNMAKAIVASATCATLARQLGNKQLLALVLSFEAASRMNSGNFENIDVIVDEALNAAHESGDTFALGMAFGMIGSRMMMAGRDLETAKEYTTKSLSLLKEHSNRFGYGMVLFSIGMGSRFQGRFAEAREKFVILLPIFAAMGDYHRTNMIHSETAHMERLEGHYEKAAQLYRKTIVEWKRLGHRAAVANQLECLAFIAKIREQTERAAKLFGAAEMIREVIHIPMNGMEQAEYDREVGDLREGMNEDDFIKLWAEGRSMSLEQAVEYALEESDG